MSKKVDPFFRNGETILNPKTSSSYFICKQLGAGAFAQCFQVYDSQKQTYALKIINYKNIQSKSVLEKVESEILIHSQLDHPNVVKMYDSFRDEDYVYLVLEYCQFKSLDQVIHKLNKEKENGRQTEALTEDQVRKMMHQLLNALKYLHENKKVVHRDLKLGNLFITENYDIKLGDFGLSAFIIGNQKKRTFCGTPNYLAPEIILNADIGHSFEVDIWSFGIILYTLLVGSPPFQKTKVKEIYETIKKVEYSFPQDYKYSRYSKELIRTILNRDPCQRPSINEILNHNFFMKKTNTIERAISYLVAKEYEVVANLNLLKDDIVLYSLSITSIKGIGYILRSGVFGIYYYDYTNIIQHGNKIMYLFREMENGKTIIRKEEYYKGGGVPQIVKTKYEELQLFLKKYGRGFESCNIDFTHILRVKRVGDATIFGLYNGVLQLDFIDDISVVLLNEGKAIYAFNKFEKIEISENLRCKVIYVLNLVK